MKLISLLFAIATSFTASAAGVWTDDVIANADGSVTYIAPKIKVDGEKLPVARLYDGYAHYLYGGVGICLMHNIDHVGERIKTLSKPVRAVAIESDLSVHAIETNQIVEWVTCN